MRDVHERGIQLPEDYQPFSNIIVAEVSVFARLLRAAASRGAICAIVAIGVGAVFFHGCPPGCVCWRCILFAILTVCGLVAACLPRRKDTETRRYRIGTQSLGS